MREAGGVVITGSLQRSELVHTRGYQSLPQLHGHF